MIIGEPLLKREVKELGVKRTSEFVRFEGKLARILRDVNGFPYIWKNDRIVPITLEEGDVICNDGGVVIQRIGEATPIPVKEIDMTEKGKKKKRTEEKKEEVKKEEEVDKEIAIQEIIPVREDFLAPAMTIERAVQIFRLYEEAKKRLLSEKDVIWYGKDGKPTGKGEGHPHIKRSGWRKLGRFFGLSCQILERKKEWAEDSEGRYYIWTYKVRASHPCGAYQDAEGVCTSRDPFFSKKHGRRIEPAEKDIMLKAQTVAFNRAISDLLGSGEVSAEELEG